MDDTCQQASWVFLNPRRWGAWNGTQSPSLWLENAAAQPQTDSVPILYLTQLVCFWCSSLLMALSHSLINQFIQQVFIEHLLSSQQASLPDHFCILGSYPFPNPTPQSHPWNALLLIFFFLKNQFSFCDLHLSQHFNFCVDTLDTISVQIHQIHQTQFACRYIRYNSRADTSVSGSYLYIKF